jgi:hypothetical protein
MGQRPETEQEFQRQRRHSRPLAARRVQLDYRRLAGARSGWSYTSGRSGTGRRRQDRDRDKSVQSPRLAAPTATLRNCSAAARVPQPESGCVTRDLAGPRSVGPPRDSVRTVYLEAAFLSIALLGRCELSRLSQEHGDSLSVLR